jgi:geranylgeranyl diphosphate synthase type I
VGTPTPLLAVATARADREQRAVLGLIGQPDLSLSDVSTIQAVMIETGAVSEIEATIDRLTTSAISAIEQTPITLDASAALVELAHYVAWRDR